jgi:molybdopterin-guanine dinucleotide biosynthesis protein
MRILAVGGLCSGSGKTTLICRILPFLPGWGVLKTSVRSEKGAGYEIVTEPAELHIPGKDTGRFLEAGASALAWLRAGPDGLAEGVPDALSLFSDMAGVVAEGNSHVFHRKPDRILVVARSDLPEIKPTARLLLPKADLVVLNRSGTGEEVMSGERLKGAGATCPILETNVDSERFVEQSEKFLSTWFPPST